MNFNNIFQPKNLVNIAFFAIGGLLVYKIVNKASNIIDTTVNKNRFIGTTLSEEQAKNLAKKIANAWGFINDDEEAVYDVFRQLKNYMDLLYLEAVYSYKDWKNNTENLYQSINGRMSDNEIKKINNILISKGIVMQDRY